MMILGKWHAKEMLSSMMKKLAPHPRTSGHQILPHNEHITSFGDVLGQGLLHHYHTSEDANQIRNSTISQNDHSVVNVYTRNKSDEKLITL